MKRTSLLASAVLLLMFLSLVFPAPQDASATIVVTGGSLEVPLAFINGGSQLSLTSDERGFSLFAITEIGMFAPGGFFRPGDPISLRAEWSGDDLDGGFTIDGVRYGMGTPFFGPTDCARLPEACGDGRVDFFGSAVAPAFDGSSAAVVSAPFTFSGLIRYVTSVAPPAITTETLTGGGVATIDLMKSGPPGFSIWAFSGASYDFQTPVPESSTLLLLGSGFAGLGGLAWRRSRKG